MAVLKGVSRSKRSESLSGKIMVDTVRGVLRVRAWPKKRGTPKSASQRWWNDWFTQANRLAKYADEMSQRRAIELTAGSGMYPRDIILSAMRGRLYTWRDQTGKQWHPMAAVQDISDSLDVLAQNVGDVLVRAVDRWRAPPVGSVGDVLVYNGDAAPPNWQTLTPGAGVVQQALAGTPIAVDDTVNEYIFNVTGYASIDFLLHDIKFAAADRCRIRVSIDDGVSYQAGASDYAFTYVSNASAAAGHASYVDFSRSNGALAHNGMGRFTNLRAGHGVFGSDVAYSTGSVARRAEYMHFAGPITHVKLYANSGNDFKTGDIQAIGLVAA